MVNRLGSIALVGCLIANVGLAQQNLALTPRKLPPEAQAELQARIEQAASQPTPRNADKRPDLTGFWNLAGPEFRMPAAPKSDNPDEIRVFGGNERLEDGNARMRASVAARRADTSLRPKYKPEYAARAMTNFDAGDKADPTFGCRLPGVQRLGIPREIFHNPNAVALLYSDMISAYGSNRFRIVPTDGRKHDPKAEPMTMGYAIGHWEGDTLVVVTRGFTDDTWIDHDGSFHSEGMVFTERFTRRGNALFYDAVTEDPYFAEPFRIPQQVLLLGDRSAHLIEEYPCVERVFDAIVNGEKH
jgi:hypothetical protein